MIAVGPRVGLGTVAAGLALFTELLPLDCTAVERAIQSELDVNPWLERVDDAAGYDVRANEIADSRETLFAHLERQLLAQRGVPPAVRMMAVQIAGELDDAGYFRTPLLALAGDRGVDVVMARRALELVQRLDPIGIAAADLGERFRLQLRDARIDDATATLLTHHLDELARIGNAHFAKERGIRPADLERALDRLRRCDPYPARNFGVRSTPIVPELFFERDERGLSVRVASHVANLRLMPATYDRTCSSEFRAARRSALVLLDALERRSTTLHRLGEALLERQRDYFLHDGDTKRLVPLSGAALARELDCSPSTISRALTARYAVAPFGVIELRSIVVRKAGKTDITVASAVSAIREVFSEIPDATDAQAVRLLRLRGIRLARRTVAKYRGIGGIAALRDRTA